MIKEISPKDAKNLIESGKAIMIDVREPSEYEEAHIENAHLMPLKELNENSLDDFQDKEIIFQCRSGGRSMRACQIFEQYFPEMTFHNLKGGIIAWGVQGLDIKP